MTIGERVCENVTLSDKGEGGDKNSEKKCDIVYRQPLVSIIESLLKFKEIQNSKKDLATVNTLIYLQK